MFFFIFSLNIFEIVRSAAITIADQQKLMDSAPSWSYLSAVTLLSPYGTTLVEVGKGVQGQNGRVDQEAAVTNSERTGAASGAGED